MGNTTAHTTEGTMTAQMTTAEIDALATRAASEIHNDSIRTEVLGSLARMRDEAAAREAR